ncbi:MAG: FGGY family carbohydrate kinase [Candidatus Limnocylindrales bacterium]|jgi:glycerol kinase
MKDFLLGIDQGTSGSRALVLDRDGNVRGYGYRSLARLYPAADRVEQDPLAVSSGVREAIDGALAQAGIEPAELAACGLASQRDTDFVWDAASGLPLANAIAWQDLRTQPLERDLHAWPLVAECRTRLGYWPGPYSAALHLKWRLANDPVVVEAAREGRLRIGLSALWVLNALGRSDGHRIDVSLAQSMCLYDFRAREYWAEWLDYLGVPRAALPDATDTVAEFGWLDLDSTRVPVRAMIGDQQAALFGYDCRATGDAECTHGTASFVNVCLGEAAPALDTIKVYLAWLLGGRPSHCLEADTTVTGAAVRWLREGAGMIATDEELSDLAETVPDAAGLVFVPAFTGLNVPYGVREARGSLLGLALAHTRAHIARAFLDSIGLQLAAILDEIDARAGVRVTRLKVGGGLSASDSACAIQADWLGIPILRSSFRETTARAAALLAGLGPGSGKANRICPRCRARPGSSSPGSAPIGGRRVESPGSAPWTRSPGGPRCRVESPVWSTGTPG